MSNYKEINSPKQIKSGKGRTQLRKEFFFFSLFDKDTKK